MVVFFCQASEQVQVLLDNSDRRAQTCSVAGSSGTGRSDEMKKKLPAALSDLRNQLLYSPDSVREAQMERLEGLIDELDPQQLYPYDYVCFRITNFRPSGNVQATFSGRNLKIDLANLLTELSESYPVPAPENGERILTIEDIGKTYNVSIRTIFRWRKRGLVSRKYVFKGGRIRNGVRESALKCFVDENREKVEKSAKFTKMTPYERKKVIELARKLSAEEKLGLSNMAERIAKEMGRARETIRYTIKAHIEEHPEEELFREVPSVLSDERKRAVYDAYQSERPFRRSARSSIGSGQPYTGSSIRPARSRFFATNSTTFTVRNSPTRTPMKRFWNNRRETASSERRDAHARSAT